MLILIPLLCFVLIFLSLLKVRLNDGICLRTSFLYTAVICGVLVFIGTEVLSVFRGLKFGFVLAYWSIVVAVAFFVYFSREKGSIQLLSLPIKNFSRLEIALLFGIGFIAMSTGIVAFMAPPNNWDSMTYHMSRVVHWIQNGSVNNYPTNIIRQLTYAPFAEFIIMHFQILSSSDRFANFIQWMSMIGCILGASLITLRLKGDRHAQFFAALIVATIPSGILQASSTQNDYVVAFWLICLVYFLILLSMDFAGSKWIYATAAGASLGFATLTKGTGCIYALPFIFWFVFRSFKKYRRNIWQPLLIIIMTALIINSPFYMRTFSLNKSILPGAESPNAINQVFNGASLFSNIVRNLSLHLGTTSLKPNNTVEQLVYNLHSFLGVDITDSRTTYGDWGFHLSGHPFHEDNAGNFLHLIFFVFCTIFFFVSKQLRKRKDILGYWAAVVASFLLFNFSVKWQPWSTRLQLPLFILYAPFAGIILSDFKKQKISISVCIILFIFSIPWVFANESRPFFGKTSIFKVPRTEQYFANNPGFEYSFVKATEEVKAQGCKKVGLRLGADSWEYLFWVLFRHNNDLDLRLEHIKVNNVSSKNSRYPLGDFMPCAIIENEVTGDSKIVVDGKNFVKKRQLTFTSVFIPDETGMLSRQNTLYHFNQSIVYDNKAMEVVQKINSDQYTGPEVMRELMQLRIRQLQEAKLVEIDELNNLYPGLGDRYRDDLVAGLEMYIEGFRTSDRRSYEDGQKMMLQWNSWLIKNRDSLR